jgi:hypothetical protein
MQSAGRLADVTEAEELAELVVGASWDDISDSARAQLKIRGARP